MRPTPRRVRTQKHAAYVRSNNVLVQDQEPKQRVAYAPSRVRAGEARTPNLVKHQRILGHPVPCGRETQIFAHLGCAGIAQYTPVGRLWEELWFAPTQSRVPGNYAGT